MWVVFVGIKWIAAKTDTKNRVNIHYFKWCVYITVKSCGHISISSYYLLNECCFKSRQSEIE